jgi:serine/threonine protein phosphatase PrpC
MTEFLIDQKPIELAAFGRSDRGLRRADNQDDFLIADLSQPAGEAYVLRPGLGQDGSATSGHFKLGTKGALILVADGMGGPAGSVASRLATTWIHNELRAAWSTETNQTPQRFATLLRHAIELANARIYQQQIENSELQGMGTTSTAVGVLDGFLYLAQIGDSRAYLVRAGTAIQLTRDQSMVQALIDAGTMTEQEAETSAHGSTILQALGTAPQVAVDMTFQEVRRGDVLFLCSDGLFRVVRREEVADVIARSDDVVAACDKLIQLANERGGPDNVTVVVVRMNGDGLETPSASDAVARNVLTLQDG